MAGSRQVGPPDDALFETLRRLEESGWESAGSIGSSEFDAAFYRQSNMLGIGAVEAAQKLDLLDDAGEFLPGFEATTDDETGVLVLGYSGPPSERYDRFIDDLVALGGELSARQAEALTREPMASEAVGAVGKLLFHLTGPSSPDVSNWGPVERTMEITKQPRVAVVADLTATSVPSFVAELDAPQAIEFLETLFAVTVQRQEALLETGATKAGIGPTLDVLTGIARGVQRELDQRRELQIGDLEARDNNTP